MPSKIRYSLVFAAILFLAAACNKTPDNRQESLPENQPGQSQQQEQQTASSSGQAQPNDSQGKSGNQPGGQQPATSAATITITQSVQGSNLNKSSDKVPAGEDAVTALRRDHLVETKQYSGIGEFVTSIDGIKPDSKHFWAFYVNGKSSSVGASSYKLKDGDKIEWKLELIK